MPPKFEITNEGETVDLGPASASICFFRDEAAWRVGLEIVSGPDQEENEVILHLKDYPVEVNDPRTQAVRINIHYDDADDRRTNLYSQMHDKTEKNRILVEPNGDGKYRVRWSGQGDMLSDQFKIDCIANEVERIDYPI
jgi:hypothetical protein